MPDMRVKINRGDILLVAAVRICAAIKGGSFVVAAGDGLGDYVLSSAEWRSLRQNVLMRDGRNCIYCGAHATAIDHLIPKVRGGLTVIENLAASCRHCNSIKGGS